MTQQMEKTILIRATCAEIWQALTAPTLMVQWMGESEMRLDIETRWVEGTPIVIRGFHHAKFENRGTVLEFMPCTALRYNYLSSISRLPDVAENYTEIGFALSPDDGGTLLTLRASGFANDTILHHVDFYWRSALHVLKKFVEKSTQSI